MNNGNNFTSLISQGEQLLHLNQLVNIDNPHKRATPIQFIQTILFIMEVKPENLSLIHTFGWEFYIPVWLHPCRKDQHLNQYTHIRWTRISETGKRILLYFYAVKGLISMFQKEGKNEKTSCNASLIVEILLTMNKYFIRYHSNKLLSCKLPIFRTAKTI